MIAVRVSAYTGVLTRVAREISKGDLIGVDPDIPAMLFHHRQVGWLKGLALTLRDIR